MKSSLLLSAVFAASALAFPLPYAHFSNDTRIDAVSAYSNGTSSALSLLSAAPAASDSVVTHYVVLTRTQQVTQDGSVFEQKQPETQAVVVTRTGAVSASQTPAPSATVVPTTITSDDSTIFEDATLFISTTVEQSSSSDDSTTIIGTRTIVFTVTQLDPTETSAAAATTAVPVTAAPTAVASAAPSNAVTSVFGSTSGNYSAPATSLVNTTHLANTSSVAHEVVSTPYAVWDPYSTYAAANSTGHLLL